MKVILQVFVLLVLVVSLQCCSKPSLRSEDTVVLTLSQEPQTLNPVSSLDLYSSIVIGFVYDPLFEVDKNLNFVPKIVESYYVSSDSTLFRFRLKKNARWHDGMPITADDIVYTFSMITNPVSRAFNKVAQYRDVEYVRKVDEYTFEVKYRQPYAPALESWSMIPIPKHIFEKEDFQNTRYNTYPIGSGPYYVKKVVSGQYIVLERVTNYWDKEKEPKIKRVVFRIIKDPTVEFSSLKVGETDLSSIRPIDWVNQACQPWFQEKFNTYKYYTLNISQIAFNLRDSILSNRLVRKALAHAMDKGEIKRSVYFDLAEPISGPFPPNSWAFDPGVRDYDFSLEKASELLDKAGWKDTDGDGIRDKEGRKLSLELIIPQGSEIGIKIGEIFKETLRKVGVELNIRVMEWSMVTKTIDSRTFQMVMFGWSLSIDPDPYDIWHSSQTNGGINYVGYSNPEVDRLCELGRKVFNRSRRKEIYAKVQRIIADDLPYLFLFSRPSLVGASKRVKGIDPSTAGIYWNFHMWSLEKP